MGSSESPRYGVLRTIREALSDKSDGPSDPDTGSPSTDSGAGSDTTSKSDTGGSPADEFCTVFCGDILEDPLPEHFGDFPVCPPTSPIEGLPGGICGTLSVAQSLVDKLKVVLPLATLQVLDHGGRRDE